MTPIFKLRFVERTVQVPFQNYKDVTESKTVRILQQWWQTHATGMTSTNGEDWVTTYAGEWRDVPLEEEQT
jgi:hypothetical protein